VKNVILTLCNRSCTKVFTLWQRISRKGMQIPEPKFESSGGKTTKTGGRISGLPNSRMVKALEAMNPSSPVDLMRSKLRPKKGTRDGICLRRLGASVLATNLAFGDFGP
jgi:hypothetical protein